MLNSWTSSARSRACPTGSSSVKYSISDCRFTLHLVRKEFQGLVRYDRLDILGLEAEQAYARDELALQVRVAELAADHVAFGNLAGRRYRQPQHQLALQVGTLAQRTAVQGVNGALVPIEHQCDLLLTARRLATAPVACGPILRRIGGNAGTDRGCVVIGERAGARTEAAAGIRSDDAGRTDADLGGNQRALGACILVDRSSELAILQRLGIELVAQIGEFVLD